MERLFSKDKIEYQTAVALGNFDSLHKGHMELIEKIILFAKKQAVKSVVYTFNVNTKANYDIIMKDSQKQDILSETNIDYLYIEDFTEEFKKLTPDEFIKTVLIDKLNAKYVVVGENYRFGYKACGTSESLKELGQEYGIHVDIIPMVVIDGNPVSSSLIRELIKEGRVSLIKKYTDRYFSIIGTVEEGKRLGRTLGFPTANIYPKSHLIIPKHGVYATITYIEGKAYQSITNVGTNPTLNEKTVKIETHIIDYIGALYRKEIKIDFVTQLRDEIKFENKEALQRQVLSDIEERRHIAVD